MHANVVVDDEFQPRQSNTGIGQLAKVKCQLGIAHVHHDFEVDGGHGATFHFTDLGLQQAVVNETGIALRAADRHQHAALQMVGRIAAADHRRNAELAGNDGCVAGTSAPVGDDGGRPLHHRFPVGVRHIGDQYVASLHLVHVFQAVDHAHRTGTNLLPDRPALCLDCAASFECIAQLGRVARLAFDGFGAGLQDIEAAVHTVLAPLDVHGAAVMFFNNQRVTGQLQHIGIRQRIPVTHLGGHFGGLHQRTACSFFCCVSELHLHQLGAQAAPDHRWKPGAQRRLVHVKLIRVDRALHHGFAQTVAGGDENHIGKAGLRVQCEHHPRCPLVRAHHALHTYAECDHIMGKAFVHAVADRPVVVQRGKDFAHLVQHGIDSGHV